MASRILLVVADARERHQLNLLLTHGGYSVVMADSLEHGRLRLASTSPDLLIASVRLGAFNGLHLAIWAHQNYPDLPVIITHDRPDAVLERDSAMLRADFVVDPLRNPEFMAAVTTAVGPPPAAEAPIRRWPRKDASGQPIEAQLAASSGRIVELSYGGMRVALEREQAIPEFVDVLVPSAGVTVKARIVWTVQSADDEVLCGAEVVATDDDEASGWREFVDDMM